MLHLCLLVIGILGRLVRRLSSIIKQDRWGKKYTPDQWVALAERIYDALRALNAPGEVDRTALEALSLSV